MLRLATLSKGIGVVEQYSASKQPAKIAPAAANRPANGMVLRDGVAAAVIAYLMWGFLPAYFKFTDHVSALEVLCHRVIWSVPFGLLIILARKQWPDVRRAISSPRVLGLLAVSALLITCNWLLYIWAVQHDQIFQASLGYFINPLIYVLIGVVIFNDPFRPLQKLAVILAAAGVLILSILGGQVPIISLVLALSFTGYGVIRKQLPVGAMPGLFIETSILLLPAIALLGWLAADSGISFSTAGPGNALLLMLAGPLTVVPLLMFAVATKRLTLSTLGFLQFIGPTLQFLLGVYYGETMSFYFAICFALICLAASVYAWDAFKQSRLVRREARRGTVS